jgi:REP element-mobilizing transposase RayT
LGNHFHIVLSVRDLEEQERLYLEREIKTKTLQPASKHLSHLFNAYSQSINKQVGRTGSLFQKNFKRKEIDSEEYFRQMVIYAHLNPLKHGFNKAYDAYPYSSYPVYLNFDHTFVNREKTLDIFGGKENFLTAHKEEAKKFQK